jgi:hypothetical protein
LKELVIVSLRYFLQQVESTKIFLENAPLETAYQKLSEESPEQSMNAVSAEVEVHLPI